MNEGRFLPLFAGRKPGKIYYLKLLLIIRYHPKKRKSIEFGRRLVFGGERRVNLNFLRKMLKHFITKRL